MMHRLYRGITSLGGPLISLYLGRRLKRGKEDADRFPERLGRPGRPRPAGPLAWVHAASVGESLSMLPLVESLIGQGFSVLMTTGTVTSARLMADRLPKGAMHQFVPVDRVAYVRAFLDHWRPDLAIWVESEFWPNLLAETHRRSVPLVLVQGRMSARSYARWSKLPAFIRTVLGRFDLCLAQTTEDANRIRALGGRDVRCLGNLKYAVPPLPYDAAALDALRAQVGGRPVWLAASTHPGEEEDMARAHLALEARFPGLLTIIVPRHPERGTEIAAQLAGLGLAVSRRSQQPDISLATQIHLADTMGELGLFYRLSPMVFMGKSLKVGGGQNPFEPARIGCAVLFGPRMDNFLDMVAGLTASGGALRVADGAGLAEALGGLLADPARIDAMRRAAARWSAAEADVLNQVMAALAPILSKAQRRHEKP
jgi:3-deoxy-D-manno-octulosonic-acid transferase